MFLVSFICFLVREFDEYKIEVQLKLEKHFISRVYDSWFRPRSTLHSCLYCYLYCCTVHFEGSLSIAHQQMH
jgi:hypothetical protein